MDLIDTHCHLNFNSFDDDRALVLDRARQAGIRNILNPGIDLPSSRDVVELSRSVGEVYAAVGVHPNESMTWRAESSATLRSLARQPKVVAIGEIGLDYYREQADPSVQQRVFGEQLAIAAEANLPVVVHNRQAWDDVIAMLAAWQQELESNSSPLAERPGVLHSFSEDLKAAHKAVELNFYIGITGPVTFKNAQVLQALVAETPLSSLLVETDAPFLTPHPYRGRRNEPAYVRFVAEKIASIKNLPLDEVAAQTTANARRLFDW